MNIRDLKYLVALADNEHFGKAADVCCVSQPALSMQIKKLEDILNVQLVERTNKSVLMTEVGKIITQHARDILDRVETLKEIAQQANDPYSGELYLGIIPTLAPYLLPHFLPHLSKLYPKLHIYLVEEQTANLVTKLKQGKIDCAILSLPCGDTDIHSLPLFEEEFILAVSPNDPLSKRKTIRFTDLKNKVLLLLEDGHCMREAALEVCYRAKASEEKTFQATSLETLRHMVASKVGMTLMPKLSIRANDAICYLPFSAPRPSRIIGMNWRPSSAKKILLEDMTLQMRKLIAPKNIVKVINTSLLCSNK